MHTLKTIEKRKFIQDTNKYLKLIEAQNIELIITHQNEPDLLITKIKSKTIKDLRGTLKVKVHGDINEHIFQEYDESI